MIMCGSVDTILLETVFAENMTHKCQSYLVGSKQTLSTFVDIVLSLCSHLVSFLDILSK